MDQDCMDEVDGPSCYVTAARLKQASFNDPSIAVPLANETCALQPENVQSKTVIECRNGFHKTDIAENLPESEKNGIFHKSAKASPANRQSPVTCGKVCESSTVAAPESVVKVARELVIIVIEKMTNRITKSSQVNHRNKHAETMLRTVEELSTKHEILFKSVVQKLGINKDNGEIVFTTVVDEIFSDRRYNWGRVVTVYAFAGWLARYCVQKQMDDYVDSIADTASEYVADRLALWIDKNGGWDAFDKFFEKGESSEEMIWRGLLYTIFGLGVGAVATICAVK